MMESRTWLHHVVLLCPPSLWHHWCGTRVRLWRRRGRGWRSPPPPRGLRQPCAPPQRCWWWGQRRRGRRGRALRRTAVLGGPGTWGCGDKVGARAAGLSRVRPGVGRDTLGNRRAAGVLRRRLHDAWGGHLAAGDAPLPHLRWGSTSPVLGRRRSRRTAVGPVRTERHGGRWRLESIRFSPCIVGVRTAWPRLQRLGSKLLVWGAMGAAVSFAHLDEHESTASTGLYA